MLIDRRNWAEQAPILKDYIAKADFIGLDCETHDDDRHDGLNQFCGYDPKTRKKSKGKKLVFDLRRTTLCGVSFYTEDMREPVYVNVGHADAELRITHAELKELLGAKREGSYWVAHNAPFEIGVFRSTIGWDLFPGIICTLQMAVSAYGPQQFNHTKWLMSSAGGIESLIPALVEMSLNPDHYEPETGKVSSKLEELMGKITAKDSTAAHSYNGLINSIAYGYGLKQAVKSHFGHSMTTFDECLNGAAHMGQLTGEQVASYGGEDAFWALRLFRHLLTIMDEPTTSVFFSQENPMIGVYADIWKGGMRVDATAIERRVGIEREEAALVLRRLRKAVRALLPFPDAANDNLLKREEWYQKNHQKYRRAIGAWAQDLDDAPTAFEELSRAAGSVSANWMKEKGKAKSAGPNFSHYMPIRVLMYDLIGAKPLIYQGKVQSDGESRGQVKDKLTDPNAIEVIDCINALAGIDQRMKLFIAPYRLLMDPDTDRLYPVVTSMLATRRMAARDPNPLQLAKRGESTYVRGFFLPDNDDHVIVSIDWSAIELVEIAEFSGDPEFCKAFSQIPHQDLHSGAAAAILEVECPGLTVDAFKGIRSFDNWDQYAEKYNLSDISRLKTNLKGEDLPIDKAYKYWRTEVGKGSNFSYWYSGYLATIGERMGWGHERTSLATERYTTHFHVAEQWRRDLIAQVQADGFIRLPDGHRYTRYEATQEWFLEWVGKFIGANNDASLKNYADLIRKIGSKIARRAGNQSVNAMIQGSCATIAKRSIIRVNEKIKEMNFDARFMIPIHDELVWSVHRDQAPDFIEIARDVMLDHPDLFQKCKLDASPSVGLTFEPWNPKTAPFGQVELFELPKEIVGEKLADTRADKKLMQLVINHLFEMRKKDGLNK